MKRRKCGGEGKSGRKVVEGGGKMPVNQEGEGKRQVGI